MGVDQKPVFCKGVLSLQVTVHDDGKKPYTLLIKDPGRPRGLSWPGGYFFPYNDMRIAAQDILRRETGVLVDPATVKLRGVVYSRTKVNGHWIGNHMFSAEALPRDEWKTPESDYFTFLAPLETINDLGGCDLEDLKGNPYEGNREWSITDGPSIAKMFHRAHRLRYDGRQLHQEIPIATLPHFDSKMPFGYGSEVASIILGHEYKGKDGFVFIKNHDSPGYALVGGKVESLNDSGSRNIDAVTCIVDEGAQEIGVNVTGLSIVGSAMTPLDMIDEKNGIGAQPNGKNSIINTCIYARATNPGQLDGAIENPQQFIRESERNKIEGIYFLTQDEFGDLALKGEMRTPDMTRLSQLFLNRTPGERPSLEHIMLLPSDLPVNPYARAETRPV